MEFITCRNSMSVSNANSYWKNKIHTYNIKKEQLELNITSLIEDSHNQMKFAVKYLKKGVIIRARRRHECAFHMKWIFLFILFRYFCMQAFNIRSRLKIRCAFASCLLFTWFCVWTSVVFWMQSSSWIKSLPFLYDFFTTTLL